jgi:prephenate dehydratase
MVTIGIQGGKGSFNDEACQYFCKVHDVKNFSIKYLFTTENVLSNLHLGKIDYGQFAIEDPLGGIVNESIDALTKYTCKIVDKFKYPINLHLLTHKDVRLEDIKIFMTHPQIFKQCKNTLKKKYPDKEIQFGKGEMIDQAKAAEK